MSMAQETDQPDELGHVNRPGLEFALLSFHQAGHHLVTQRLKQLKLFLQANRPQKHARYQEAPPETGIWPAL